ncbi:hypothetical protein K8F61_09730 [Microbacterium resistens]|uniref:Uncharacterized protein n=1 Tax=Microbacterium resistens TaxID=156977 RepID=A0ABY3RMR8_9MICO|nr:hypothetical protein [Microbacterium resistens]UGS24989.1 hypothetical protein K8F61_09730 [Microbacterium resistens]
MTRQEIYIPSAWFDPASSPIREIWAEGSPPDDGTEEDEVVVVGHRGRDASFVGPDAGKRQVFLEHEVARPVRELPAGAPLTIELRARRGIAGIVLVPSMLDATLAQGRAIVIRNQRVQTAGR